jgi:hypothetical protein
MQGKIYHHNTNWISILKALNKEDNNAILFYIQNLSNVQDKENFSLTLNLRGSRIGNIKSILFY